MVDTKIVSKDVITKDMLIGDVVQRFPSAVDVLLKHGVHCVGCGGAYAETIQEGLAGHGMSEQDVQKIVVQLNESIPEVFGVAGQLQVTATAVEKIKVFLAEEESGTGLRLGVLSGGCSGYQYALQLDKPKSDDEVVKVQGVSFIMDKENFDLLKGVRVDYIDGLQGAGFKISNPNASHTCGCGQSFH